MPGLFDEEVRIVGTLHSVRFEADSGDWHVANVDTRRGRVTVVGNLAGAAPGEGLQLKGKWVQDKKFGRQFKVEDTVIVPPTTREGIVRYLSSGLIEGVGPVIAERLVAAFGEETLDVIESERHRLREVPGIGRVRQKRILTAWDKQRAVRQVMLFLSSHGVSANFAHRIYEVYGDDAVNVVRKHPYKLARDVFGIGFRSADRIAREIGIRPDDPERIAAGLDWVLYEATGKGHVFLPQPELIARAGDVLDIDDGAVSDILDQVIKDGSLVCESIWPERPRAIYGLGPHGIECELAERIKALSSQRRNPQLHDLLKTRAAQIEKRLGLALERSQRSAVDRLIGQPLGILTGGPGTGKTTIIRIFTDTVRSAGAKVVLAAPTGRAARRLSEAAGQPAETLHRALSFSFKEGRFMRDEENPLEANLIVVDEASMLDQRLARALLRAVPPKAQLLLVGDADQLPSVGAGNVLHDLLEVSSIPAARLTEVFRQARSSDVVRNAHRIRVGQMPESTSKKPTGNGDFFHIVAEEPLEALEKLVEVVCRRIPKAFGLDPFNDVQVLAPMHKGDCGIEAINRRLQQELNPRGNVINFGEREFRTGDKVIQLRNNYTREVFNGQIGRLERVDEDGTIHVRFDGRLVDYGRSELFELALAYCISIHKSQGSEYEAVIAPITTQHYIMLQRNLLYTAVTRAKSLVCLIGQKRALGQAVRNEAPTMRYTALAERCR